jgi:hypothetical protein
MKKSLFILLIFMLNLFACNLFDDMDIGSPQAYSFIKFFTTYPVFKGADVKQIDGSGYAILGTVESFTDGTQMCLIRTDEFGNTFNGDSARYYGRALDDNAYCLQVLADGGFAILGSSQNPQNEKLEVYFIRTNSQGDTLWTRTISGDGDIEAYHFEVNQDGSFYLTGYSEVSNINTDKQIWLFALESTGKNLWPIPREYGGNKDDVGKYLQILSDGRLVITGYTRSYPYGTLNNQAFVLKTNNIGLSGTFREIKSTAEQEGSCIRALDENNFLVIGTTKSLTSSTGYDIMLRKISLIITESDNQWEKTFGGIGNDYGKRVIVRGNSIYLLGTITSANINSSITLITTDLNGNNERYSNFGLGTQLSCSSFENTSDKGFIITGTNKYSESSSSVALIKTKTDTSL